MTRRRLAIGGVVVVALALIALWAAQTLQVPPRLAAVPLELTTRAVVPGIRGETDKLVAALKELTDLRQAIAREKDDLTGMMTASLEEEKRLDLLIAENDRTNTQTAAELEAEPGTAR